MKRFFSLAAALALVVFVFTQCTSSLPKRITKLADKVEAKGTNFSTQNWENTAKQFKKMINEFIDNYDKFKPSERKEVYKAVARFTACAIKAGAGSVVTGLTDLLNSASEETNSFLDSAKDFLEELGL